MTGMPTKIWIETSAKTALPLAVLARLLDEETVGPTEMALIIRDSLSVILTGIERIDRLTSQEPIISRSPIFHYFDRSRIINAIDTLENFWTEVGQSFWVPKEEPASPSAPQENPEKTLA